MTSTPYLTARPLLTIRSRRCSYLVDHKACCGHTAFPTFPCTYIKAVCNHFSIDFVCPEPSGFLFRATLGSRVLQSRHCRKQFWVLNWTTSTATRPIFCLSVCVSASILRCYLYTRRIPQYEKHRRYNGSVMRPFLSRSWKHKRCIYNCFFVNLLVALFCLLVICFPSLLFCLLVRSLASL